MFGFHERSLKNYLFKRIRQRYVCCRRVAYTALIEDFSLSYPLHLEGNWLVLIPVTSFKAKGGHFCSSMSTNSHEAEAQVSDFFQKHILRCVKRHGLNTFWFRQSWVAENTKVSRNDQQKLQQEEQQLNAALGLSRVELYLLLLEIGCVDKSRRVKWDSFEKLVLTPKGLCIVSGKYGALTYYGIRKVNEISGSPNDGPAIAREYFEKFVETNGSAKNYTEILSKSVWIDLKVRHLVKNQINLEDCVDAQIISEMHKNKVLGSPFFRFQAANKVRCTYMLLEKASSEQNFLQVWDDERYSTFLNTVNVSTENLLTMISRRDPAGFKEFLSKKKTPTQKLTNVEGGALMKVGNLSNYTYKNLSSFIKFCLGQSLLPPLNSVKDLAKKSVPRHFSKTSGVITINNAIDVQDLTSEKIVKDVWEWWTCKMTDVLKYHLDGMAEAGHAPPHIQAFNSDRSIQSILINIQIDGGGDSLKALARIIVGATKLSDDFTSRRPHHIGSAMQTVKQDDKLGSKRNCPMDEDPRHFPYSFVPELNLSIQELQDSRVFVISWEGKQVPSQVSGVTTSRCWESIIVPSSRCTAAPQITFSSHEENPMMFGESLPRFQQFLDESDTTFNVDDLHITEIPFTIKAAMDLKLTARMQGNGRIHLDKSHCMFCDTRVSRTDNDNKQEKDVWYPNVQPRFKGLASAHTPQEIEDSKQLTMLSQSALDTGATSYAWWQCGWCTPEKNAPPFPTYLNSIPVEDWVPPILHIMLGTACKPYLALIRFIDVHFRQTDTSIMMKLEKNTNEDNQITKLRQYLEFARSPDPEHLHGLARFDILDDSSPRGEEEEDEYFELMQTFSICMDPSTGKRNQQLVDLDSKLVLLSNNQVVRMFNNETQYASAHTNPTFSACAQILSKYGVDASVHFGGTLIGRHCDKLLENADKVWEEILQVFLQQAAVNLKDGGCEPNELKEKSEIFCQQMKGLSNNLKVVFDRLRSEDLSTEDQISQLETVAIPQLANLWQELAKSEWNNVGKAVFTTTQPKFHTLISHTVHYLRTVGPMGLLIEEHIESLHHSENLLNVRFLSIRDFATRETYKNQAASIRHHPEVMRTLHEFQASRKRQNMKEPHKPNPNPRKLEVEFKEQVIEIQPKEGKNRTPGAAKAAKDEAKQQKRKAELAARQTHAKKIQADKEKTQAENAPQEKDNARLNQPPKKQSKLGKRKSANETAEDAQPQKTPRTTRDPNKRQPVLPQKLR